MVRAFAIFRIVLLVLLLAGTPLLVAPFAAPLAAQTSEAFAPNESDYARLGTRGAAQKPVRDKPELRRSVGHAKSTSRRQVMDAIWSASQNTGVDYSYLLAQAQIESGLDPDAKARTSSAAGLYQFIEGTWLRSLERYRPELEKTAGHEGQDQILETLFNASRASRSDRLALRHDPQLASMIAAAYAMENGRQLKEVLGRKATGTELYLAHFLGGAGADRFLRAWIRSPQMAAAHLFPKAARANPSIFYAQSGRSRTLQGVLGHFENKMARALELFDPVPSELFSAAHLDEFWAAQAHLDLSAFSSLSLEHASGSDASSKKLHWATRRAMASVTGGMLKDLKPEQIDGFAGHSAQVTSTNFATWTEGLIHSNANRPVQTLLQTASSKSPNTPRSARSHPQTCNHIAMCYSAQMSTSTVTQVRALIKSGSYTKAGIARAAGLHANTLRDASEPDWNPTSETLAKLQKFVDANDDTPVLVGAEEIIDEARNGRMYILVDDEDRENEGDLIIPAQMATPAAVNFMATHGRGLICLALDKARVDQLGLDPMSRNNKESMQTAFTVSIEAKDGVTTGISAADRARTISVAIDASKGADDIVTPGHVFPLMARDGGTLVRAGHTEAAVDISRIAGLNPSGVICEIMNEDGTMARLDDLIEFARKHSLKIGTIRDLIAYRMRNDHLVERVDERSFESDYGGQWRMITYRNTVADNEAYALQKGHVTPDEPTLARVHPISVFDDVLGAPGERKRTLQRAMGAIGEKGAGVIVILTQRVGQGGKWTQDEEHRNIGIGSQILADLGVREMTLLSNSRPDLVALEGYGITIAGHQPIPE